MNRPVHIHTAHSLIYFLEVFVSEVMTSKRTFIDLPACDENTSQFRVQVGGSMVSLDFGEIQPGRTYEVRLGSSDTTVTSRPGPSWTVASERILEGLGVDVSTVGGGARSPRAPVLTPSAVSPAQVIVPYFSPGK